MLQNPDIKSEPLCRITETGFELFGISQETPLLKDFSLNKQPVRVRGFREVMMRYSSFRPIIRDGRKIPGECRPFLTVLQPALNWIEVLIQDHHSQAPIEELLLNLKVSNAKIPSDIKKIKIEHIQLNYVITGIRLLEKIFSDSINNEDAIDLFYDTCSILSGFYNLEGKTLASNHGEEFFKNSPKSGLCPWCLAPMEDPKDNRSSEICQKCRHDIKIEKQRQRRGTKLIGERYCACGCGEIIAGRPNKKYVNDAHGRRKQGDRK
jgi:hypothetical protein